MIHRWEFYRLCPLWFQWLGSWLVIGIQLGEEIETSWKESKQVLWEDPIMHKFAEVKFKTGKSTRKQTCRAWGCVLCIQKHRPCDFWLQYHKLWALLWVVAPHQGADKVPRNAVCPHALTGIHLFTSYCYNYPQTFPESCPAQLAAISTLAWSRLCSRLASRLGLPRPGPFPAAPAASPHQFIEKSSDSFRMASRQKYGSHQGKKHQSLNVITGGLPNEKREPRLDS